MGREKEYLMGPGQEHQDTHQGHRLRQTYSGDGRETGWSRGVPGLEQGGPHLMLSYGVACTEYCNLSVLTD